MVRFHPGRFQPSFLRSVAQPGSAPGSGPGGRRFESFHSDCRKAAIEQERRERRGATQQGTAPPTRRIRGEKVALSCGLLSTFYSQALRVREAPQRRNISPSFRVSSSAAAAPACQAGGRGFESRLTLSSPGYRHGSPLSPRAGMDIAVVAQSVERLFCNQLTGVRFPPTAVSLATRRKLYRMSGGLPNRMMRVRIPSGASGQVA